MGKAELSTDPGKGEQCHFSKLNKKARRHSGRYTPKLHIKGKISEMMSNAEEPSEEYNDWIERRDGWRGDLDQTKLRNENGNFWYDIDEIKKINERVRKKLAIREAKQIKKMLKDASLTQEN